MIANNFFRIRHIKRYRSELFAGYGLAAFITFLAIIIHSLPYDTVARCDSFRPRFGESQCFFSGILQTKMNILGIATIIVELVWNFLWMYISLILDRKTKAYWFYLPIGLMIIANIIVFFMTLVILCKLNFGSSAGAQRSLVWRIISR